ncbi:TOBE domain-containing protein [Chrysiogenes arsenatis]|uniref:TOBE domain-containing protein n=1 Tax=Chrysiogenes arsenatis TaxID=309797 RepID=UPI00040798EE|nr:TOBE domain-containing protein [Chrysiogenes arsenatis]
MNRLCGIINGVESDGSLSLVDVCLSNDQKLSALVVETPARCPWLQLGQPVQVLFKETEVSIAKNLTGDISLRNRLPGTIRQIRTGGLLAEITLESLGETVVSIITERSAQRLQLAVGDDVEWLVKANEISLRGNHAES